MLRVLKSMAPYLPKAFDQAQFAFNGTVLSGTPAAAAAVEARRRRRSMARWVRNWAAITSRAISRQRRRPQIDQLVKNVTAAMGDRLKSLDWMAPETQAPRRVTKLAAFTPKIGYPDTVARLFGAASRARRPGRQRRARQRVRVCRDSRSSASRSTAANGS